MTIQDCWRARNLPLLQRAVRLCLERMNIVVVELDENYEKTCFDGVWRFSDAGVKKNIDIAPRYFGDVRDWELEIIPLEEQKQRMENWVKQYTTKRVVTYCNACLKDIEIGGACGVHLMELMTSRMH